MRRDHRPYYIKKAHLKIQEYYARYFLKPRFDSLGEGFFFIHPWNLEVFGSPIEVGKYANILTTPENKVRLTVWPEKKGHGKIKIGDYCLICPGVRISSAEEIIIEDDCMMAGGAYITDADWHDVYDRVWSIGNAAPIHIEKNVWIGDNAVVCKGVTIGENSVIGARAVVTQSIPPNCIAAGNPARVVRELDPEKKLYKRSDWYADPEKLARDIDGIDRENMMGNSLMHWFRTILFPSKND
ncbi:MAG: acyltransferase [Desulfobacterales bacterium]|nr:acyltransferase [Desulfobacterales bacterium]